MLVGAIPPEGAELLCKPGWQPRDANSGGLWVLRGLTLGQDTHQHHPWVPSPPRISLSCCWWERKVSISLLLLVPVPGAFCRKTLPRCPSVVQKAGFP